MSPLSAPCLVAAILLCGGSTAQRPDAAATFAPTNSSVGGRVTEREVFNGFGCSGENQGPQLSWPNAPEGTTGFAIMMCDPDAPRGSGWWRWLVFDIPAGTKELPMGAGTPRLPGLPADAIQRRTDLGGVGYGGPCPRQGHEPHRYMVTVHALDTTHLGSDAEATPAAVGFDLNTLLLARASQILYYQG